MAENANEATRRDILDGLRDLSSVGVIRENEKDMFTANNIIKYLSDSRVESAVYHKYDSFLRKPAIHKKQNETQIDRHWKIISNPYFRSFAAKIGVNI